MIPSFLFLLYLLSNTVLLGTEASARGRGKVTMIREYIVQPSFLPAVDSPLWDVFVPASHQKGNLTHAHTQKYIPQECGTKLLSLNIHLGRTSEYHYPVILFPLEC